MLSLVSKKINILTVRSFSMAAVDKVVNFEEMEKLAHDKKVLIIDVREPDEVKSTSKIGCSINIPLNKLQHELKDTTNEDFNKMYGQSKPVSTTPLIFYCMRGVRALKALQLSESLGFVNARYYKGSWEEWSKKHK